MRFLLIVLALVPVIAGAFRLTELTTGAEIAAALHITLSTVKSHLASLMSKLAARNRVELAIWAHENRWRGNR